MLGVRTSRVAWSSNEISLQTQSHRYQSPQIKRGRHDTSQAGNRLEMAPRESISNVLTSIELNGFPL